MGALNADILLQQRSYAQPHRASAGPSVRMRMRMRIGRHHDDVIAKGRDVLKAYIGVDSKAKIVHSVTATPANVHDS